jgi:hypothetical protein
MFQDLFDEILFAIRENKLRYFSIFTGALVFLWASWYFYTNYDTKEKISIENNLKNDEWGIINNFTNAWTKTDRGPIADKTIDSNNKDSIALNNLPNNIPNNKINNNIIINNENWKTETSSNNINIDNDKINEGTKKNINQIETDKQKLEIAKIDNIVNDEKIKEENKVIIKDKILNQYKVNDYIEVTDNTTPVKDDTTIGDTTTWDDTTTGDTTTLDDTTTDDTTTLDDTTTDDTTTLDDTTTDDTTTWDNTTTGETTTWDDTTTGETTTWDDTTTGDSTTWDDTTTGDTTAWDDTTTGDTTTWDDTTTGDTTAWDDTTTGDTTAWDDTTTGDTTTWDITWTTPEEIEEYFNNNAYYNLGWWIFKKVKMLVDFKEAPIYPTPVVCANGYYKLWTYSNIISYSTIRLPFSNPLNILELTNEYIPDFEWKSYYYKIFNVNWVKNWSVTYKTSNPDKTFYWVFTICIES